MFQRLLSTAVLAKFDSRDINFTSTLFAFAVAELQRVLQRSQQHPGEGLYLSVITDVFLRTGHPEISKLFATINNASERLPHLIEQGAC